MLIYIYYERSRKSICDMNVVCGLCCKMSPIFPKIDQRKGLDKTESIFNIWRRIIHVKLI